MTDPYLHPVSLWTHPFQCDPHEHVLSTINNSRKEVAGAPKQWIHCSKDRIKGALTHSTPSRRILRPWHHPRGVSSLTSISLDSGGEGDPPAVGPQGSKINHEKIWEAFSVRKGLLAFLLLRSFYTFLLSSFILSLCFALTQ